MSSSSPNISQWIWPEPGVDVPPYSVTGGFGPVSRQDSIVLQFSPASYAGEIRLYCGYENGEQGDVWPIESNKGSPFTYLFNETTDNGNDAEDTHICHFFSLNGTAGNTVTFEYLNTPTRDSVVWQQDGTSTAAASSTTTTTTASTTTSIAATSTSSIQSTTSAPSTTTTPDTNGLAGTATQSPDGTPSPSSSAVPSGSSSSTSTSLSAGAAVGITLGVVAVLIAAGALAWFLIRRRRRRKAAGPMPIAAGEKTQPEVPGQPMNAASGRKMGELDGQARSEMAGHYASELRADRYTSTSELPAEQRSELPGS